MACSVKALVRFGIFLAVMDILHGLTTLLFYGYYFIVYHFYLCPTDLVLTACRNKLYIYEQGYSVRTYIGLGEGAVTFIFDVIYIVALSKHMSWLTWLWLLKSVGVIGINIFYIGKWIVRSGTYNLISSEPQEYQLMFPKVGEGLTAAQVIIMVLYCIIGALFTSKVSKERAHSRVKLHRNSRIRNVLALGPEAHPRDTYGDEDSGGSVVSATVDNHLVKHNHNHSASELALSGSNSSMDQVGQLETLRQPNNHVGQADTIRQPNGF